MKHHPAIVDPAEISGLLKAIDSYSGHPSTCAALRLAPLLFVRPGELRQAKWEDFNLNEGVWNYSPSKGGIPFIMPLPRQALEILQEQRCLTGDGKFVFPSVRSQARPMSDNTINAALQRLDFKGKMSAHGFRAMARTVLAEQLNVPAEYIEQQLAHAVKDANGRAYNRTTFLAQRKAMLQKWADYLDSLKSTPLSQLSLVRESSL